MRILFVNGSIEWPPHNGPSIHRYQLVRCWTELGHHVVTLNPDQNPLAEVVPKKPWSVFKQVRQADVIYCRTQEGYGPATALSAWPWKLMIPKRTPVIWEINVSLDLKVSMQPSEQQEHEAFLNRLKQAGRRVDHVIAVSEQIAKHAADRLELNDASVIQNGSDPELFSPDKPWPDAIEPTEKLRVVWIGSHSNRIHDADLIQALGQYIDEHQLPIQLHIIGNTRSLFNETLPDSFVFHGPVSYLELPGYLAAMDVGLALYNIVYDGGSPLKLFDYLASGTVPICSASQSMRTILDGQDIGLIGDWTPKTLADTLIQLMQNPERRDQMAQAGRQRLIEHHSWQAISEQKLQVMLDAQMQRGARR